ncbi:MAG: T9SS type A sorting domain-containing protein [Saprospiraceae bacterium]|nr:T9SS type A sorting domain-containing protein [Saprospiraceae bacterium]
MLRSGSGFWKVAFDFSDTLNAIPMKDLFTLCLLLFLQSSTAFGQFESMPSPTDQDLRDVLFINPSLAVAVGDSGVIIRSDDGGESWDIVQGADQESLVKVAFFDQVNGIAVGSNIYLTSDAGNTWTSQNQPGSFADVEVLSNSDCLISSPVTGIWRSADMGKTWEVLLDENKGEGVTHMSFISSDIGYALQTGQGGGTMSTLHSMDGGETWATIEAQSGQESTVLEALEFISPSLGYRAGWYLGHLTRTTDAAENWTPATYTDPSVQGQWYDVHVNAAHPDISYVCGWYGSIAKTTDGGLTWFPLESGASSTTSLYGIHFIHQYLGCAVGYGGTIVCTTNGGETVRTENPESDIQISVHPNPATNQVYLIPEGQVRILDLEVWDANGRSVMRRADTELFDVSALPAGWYQLKIKTSLGPVTEKLLIQR